ncbi:UDP-glucose 4-epimerase GalE [Patescibacteria group bacterium]
MNKKVLITGGAGYIGSHAVREFLLKGYEVIVFDNLSRGHKNAIESLKKYGNLTFVEGDLTKLEDVKNLFSLIKEVDGVLHFAALCSVNESTEDPKLYFYNNVYGTMNILNEMVENNVNNLVFSSTCAVYGESQYLPIDEKHPTKPTNPYGESKCMVEKMLVNYSKAYGLNNVILRYFNVCGAADDGNIGDAKNPSVHLMQNAVRGALNIEPFKLTYPEVDTKDLSPIRDYIDVQDLIDAHFKAFEYLTKGGKSNTFNLGTGKGNSVLEIVEKVEEKLKVDLPRETGQKREGEYAAVYADFKKAKEILNWEPKRNLEDSVNSLVTWYENHPKGYE